jgi:heterodisulfide reductase subunit A
VLAAAVLPKTGSRVVADMLGIPMDTAAGEYGGFYIPSNDEMEPVISPVAGIFLAGAGLGPKDIPETVAQASGAAAKVLSMFQRSKVQA